MFLPYEHAKQTWWSVSHLERMRNFGQWKVEEATVVPGSGLGAANGLSSLSLQELDSFIE
jgi:hypothetical protein